MRVITATEKFDAAHMLPQHEGKCSSLHGHTWGVEFTVTAADVVPLHDDGMIIDYGVFKAIVDKLDHAYIVARDRPTDELEQLCQQLGMKVAYIDSKETTAEALAEAFCNSVVTRLRGRYAEWAIAHFTVKCTVHETVKHSASYTWCAR